MACVYNSAAAVKSCFPKAAFACFLISAAVALSSSETSLIGPVVCEGAVVAEDVVRMDELVEIGDPGAEDAGLVCDELEDFEGASMAFSDIVEGV